MRRTDLLVFLIPFALFALACSSDDSSQAVVSHDASPDSAADAAQNTNPNAEADSGPAALADGQTDVKEPDARQDDAQIDVPRDTNPDVLGDAESDRNVTLDAPSDADLCSPPEIRVYETPGCGASEPTPRCVGPSADACLGYFCGCDGVTITGCGRATRPYAHVGPCEDEADAADAADASEASTDAVATSDAAGDG